MYAGHYVPDNTENNNTSSEPLYDGDVMPLTFVAEKKHAFITLKRHGAENDFDTEIQYRTDSDTNWRPYILNTEIHLENAHSWIQFKNNTTSFSKFENDEVKYLQFDFNCYLNGKIQAQGNINSLINYSEECTDYCFYKLFENCDELQTCPELTPTTLKRYCYAYMFSYCTELKYPPVLPATTLAERCYYSMFEGCEQLMFTPELPATTLAANCYSYMFKNCTNLFDFSNLPAERLTYGCYLGMFYRL
jgi:hypothetical protein